MGPALKTAIRENLPFALYRLPKQDKVKVVIQKSKELTRYPYDAIDQLSGFFFAPFRGKKINHLICLKPDIEEEFDFSEMTENDDLDILVAQHDEDSDYVMTEEEYIERAEYLIEVLKDGKLRKVVMSRVLAHPLPDHFKTAKFLKNLMGKYPNAFVYLVNLPGIGMWTGATPEVLFKMEEEFAETVALAGTQPVDNFKWSEKEIKEQQIVMDYIEELLFNNGISEYGRTGPYTVKAGNVVHLKTRYNLSLEQVEGQVGKLITQLHPTPAVCGLPRVKAYELIRKVEKHNRSFYSGFLGPWNLSGNSQLYVNLRCGQLNKGKISLFIGGGLTAESIPESEWEETVRKSQTLLSVVEKM